MANKSVLNATYIKIKPQVQISVQSQRVIKSMTMTLWYTIIFYKQYKIHVFEPLVTFGMQI